MSREFKYPTLFKPEENLQGYFEEDTEKKYPILRIDKPGGGVELRLITLDKKVGRREVANCTSLSYTAAIKNIYEAFKLEVGLDE